jgi:hypothetical protein
MCSATRRECAAASGAGGGSMESVGRVVAFIARKVDAIHSQIGRKY